MWRIVVAVLVVCPAFGGEKQNPAEKRDVFAGVYQTDKMKLELRVERKQRYRGLVSFNGKVYPVTATANREKLEGVFADDTGTFPFQATLSGERLQFVTGGVTYALDRQIPVNPLAERAASPPGSAESKKEYRHASGIEFRVPEGWTVRDTPAAALLFPPGSDPGAQNSEEMYVLASHEGFAGIEDPALIDQLRHDLAGTGLRFDVAGKRETYSAAGQAVTVLTWELKNPETGVPMMIRIFLSESAGRVQSLAAIAARERVLGWDPQLRLIAAGVKYELRAAAPGAAVPQPDSLVQFWTNRLNGMVLTQSRSGAGVDSRKVWYLAPDNSFRYTGSAAVPGSQATTQATEGRWRILGRVNQVLLELTLKDGTQNLLPLAFEGGNTLVDGVPTLVTGP